MKINTRVFGEIEIEEEKIIYFENGIIGFPDLKKYTLIFDAEKKGERTISWLQSLEEPDLALPVLDPLTVMPDYTPDVQEELLEPMGNLNDTNTYVLVTVTVPKKLEDIAVNLKAPVIINTDTNKAIQVIIENDFPVRYNIYDIIKEKAGE